MDLLGRLIHEERISPGPTFRLDISSSPGTYLLRLNDAGRLSQGFWWWIDCGTWMNSQRFQKRKPAAFAAGFFIS